MDEVDPIVDCHDGGIGLIRPAMLDSTPNVPNVPKALRLLR